MSHGTNEGRSPRAALLRDAALSLVLTALLAYDWWGFAVPAGAAPEEAALAVLGGGAVGALLSSAGVRDWAAGTPLERVRRNSTAALALFVVALAVGLSLFPDGLPVAGEIGFVAALWAAFLARALLTVRGTAAAAS